MCGYINPIPTITKFVILMHPKEFKKVKNNTGHLTHQSLRNSELFVGIDFSNHKRINEIIATHESYILFPSAHAINLTHEAPHAKSKKPIALFLIDSTWACTKKMFNESKNLQRLAHMSFESSRVSEYEIKEQPEQHYLSTIETSHEVLKLLDFWHVENLTCQNLDGFLDPFHEMIKYQKELIANPKSNAVRFKPRRA
jgi:DTW domain-containing protein YfiP